MKKGTIGLLGGGLLLVAVGGFAWQGVAPAPLDAFASCIEESGATFYGAYWCPHCQEQNRMFGGADDKLPYVECSARGSRNMLQVCQDAGVEAYPTWEFADGERMTGTVQLATLAEKTGCALPEEN